MLLFLEIIFFQKGFLGYISERIVDVLPLNDPASLARINFLNTIVAPVTDLFILLNNTAVDLMSTGNKDIHEVVLKCCQTLHTHNFSSATKHIYFNQTKCLRECNMWCMPMLKSLGESGTGVFWIILSIVVLLFSLFAIVKVFSEILTGSIAKYVTKGLNSSFPGKFKCFTQVFLFITAMFLTIIVQSSNIITATLVPLCAMGIISLQKVYVMTLGSNIGTTVTGILTAFTCPPSSLKKSMQLAFVYTFFNLLGVLFWLPIPVMRLPKVYASKLGNIVFDYRWFLYVYISMIYFVFPLTILLLALIPHWIGLAIIGLPSILLVICYFSVMVLRIKFPSKMPSFLLDMTWIPSWLRSLEPYDKIIKRAKCSCQKGVKIKPAEPKKLVSLIFEKHEPRSDVLPDEPGFLALIIRRHTVLNGLVSEANKVN